jgi:hypothetical protein
MAEQAYSNLQKEADKIEPRVARASNKAALALRGRVKVTELAEALEAGEQAALAYLAALDVADAYVPLGRILEDTVLKGAKVAAEEGLDV